MIFDRLVQQPDRLASYLALGHNTPEKLRVYGGGPSFVRLGRLVRYRPADLDAWVEGRIRTSTSDPGDGQPRLKREARYER